MEIAAFENGEGGVAQEAPIDEHILLQFPALSIQHVH